MNPRGCVLTSLDHVVVIAYNPQHADLVTQWTYSHDIAVRQHAQPHIAAALADAQFVSGFESHAPTSGKSSRDANWSSNVKALMRTLGSHADGGSDLGFQQCGQAAQRFLDQISQGGKSLTADQVPAGYDEWLPDDPDVGKFKKRIVVVGPTRSEQMDDFLNELHDWRRGGSEVTITVIDKDGDALEVLQRRLVDAKIPLYASGGVGIRLVKADPMTTKGLHSGGIVHATSIVILATIDESDAANGDSQLVDSYEIILHNRIANFLAQRGLPRPFMIGESLSLIPHPPPFKSSYEPP